MVFQRNCINYSRTYYDTISDFRMFSISTAKKLQAGVPGKSGINNSNCDMHEDPL